jgi:hypothetical protein
MGAAELLVQLKNFSSNQYVQGGKEFLSSNSIIAKFAFLILVLIVFMLFLSLGSFILAKIFSNKHNPILIDGMINANQQMVIPQDPSKKGAIPIYRSDNARDGLEFPWSVWIFVDDFTYKENEVKHVFHKGNDNVGSNGKNMPNNGPGLYITGTRTNENGNTAGLLVIMNTFKNLSEEVIVDNLPLHKWVNVIIRVTKQTQLDVYINGTLTKRHMLSGIPKQNYGDVYVSMNGGFMGNTSELRYFEYALGTNQIQSLVDKGPKLVAAAGSLDTKKNGADKYLSTRWYLTTATDMS